MSSTIKFTGNTDMWVSSQISKLQSGLQAMATSIGKNAQMTTPRLNNHLVNSMKVSGSGNERSVTFGGGAIKYAAYQERGMRADGSHVVRHYTSSGTGKAYLKTAGDRITAQGLGKFI